ncbi:ATPase, T2SS/T4P/T4SS family [Rhizorhabdus sp. FW153]|uniref:ATPase, T2SS/T4P/T4SS family n=1 Tax=Rhizorhabdus sp. FW153 TaxID=3400216 RepID=UPI003CF16A03
MTVALRAVDDGKDVFLSAYLGLLGPWLEREDVTELLVNRPGELWVEGGTGMERHALPALDARFVRRLAEQIARVSNQGVNREQPLLAATLPDGARVQIVAPTATRGDWALAIRRHRLLERPLESYGHTLVAGQPPLPPFAVGGDPIAYLRDAVRQRRTILISGGTSTGKTTFLNALLGEIGAEERLVLVEDTPEIRLPVTNGVGLVAVKGTLGEARVTSDDLVQAALRLRPDRIVLGELRGAEVVSFLRAINTGHPGSFATIHANSPRGALEQLVLMVMQTGLGLGRDDTLAYARTVIDIVVQLDRSGGQRGIAAVTRTEDI